MSIRRWKIVCSLSSKCLSTQPALPLLVWALALIILACFLSLTLHCSHSSLKWPNHRKSTNLDRSIDPACEAQCIDSIEYVTLVAQQNIAALFLLTKSWLFSWLLNRHTMAFDLSMLKGLLTYCTMGNSLSFNPSTPYNVSSFQWPPNSLLKSSAHIHVQPAWPLSVNLYDFYQIFTIYCFLPSANHHS